MGCKIFKVHRIADLHRAIWPNLVTLLVGHFGLQDVKR